MSHYIINKNHDPISESIWSDALAKLDIMAATIVSESDYDPNRRTYTLGDKLYKILLTDYENTGHPRQQTFLGEYAILEKCIGITGIPYAIDCIHNDGLDVLVLTRCDGEEISKLCFGVIRSFLLLARLGIILFNLSVRGISHNDVRASNVLMDAQGRVYLIDYDQAAITGFFPALMRNFLGMRIGILPIYGSLWSIVKYLIKRMLMR